MNRFRITLIAVALSAFASQTLAADASKLGTELTPIGAEKAGNKAGTIPAWTGNEVQQTGWSYGEMRGEHFKYKEEKPLYTIDASNADKFGDRLSPGHVAKLKQVKGYTMIVSQSQRTFCMH